MENYDELTKEEGLILRKLEEDMEISKDGEVPIITDIFITKGLLSYIKTIGDRLGVSVREIALYEDSEKILCLFYPKGVSYIDDEYLSSYEEEVAFFRIKGGSKFKELRHKDYLGTIMSLGIKREKLGDLIIKGGYCYGVIVGDLYEFLENNLKVIGRVDVEIEKIEKIKIEPEYEEIRVLSSSLRLDTVISNILNTSRTKVDDLLKEGKVKVNYRVPKKKNKVIVEEDVITINGKYIYKGESGRSKKDKYYLNFKKFI